MKQKPLKIATIAFVFLLFILCIANGQGFGGGPTLGLNFSQIDGDGVGGYKKVGLNLGGFVYYSFSEKLALQPEILFSQKGAREVDAIYTWNFRSNYFDLPIMLRYTALNKSFGTLLVEAGPLIGYMLNAKRGLRPLTQDVTAEYNRLSYEIQAGASWRFANRMVVGLRHSMSVVNFRPNTYPRYFGYRYISIFLRFDLGKNSK